MPGPWPNYRPEAERRLRQFVEHVEDSTAVRMREPLPEYLTKEATRLLDELYPGRTRT